MGRPKKAPEQTQEPDALEIPLAMFAPTDRTANYCGMSGHMRYVTRATQSQDEAQCSSLVWVVDLAAVEMIRDTPNGKRVQYIPLNNISNMEPATDA